MHRVAQGPDFGQGVGIGEQLLFAGARFDDVDGGVDAPVGDVAAEHDFAVARTLELFEDHFVHATAGIHQCRGDDREAAAVFDVACGAEEAFGFVQGVGVDTTAEHLAAAGCDGIVGAGEAGDGVKQYHHVFAQLHPALGFFDHQFGHADVVLRRQVEGGAVDFAVDAALHVGDFFGAFVHQQYDQLHFRVVVGDAVGQLFHQLRFTRSRRCDDQSPLPFADGGEKIQHAPGELGGMVLQLQALLGIERREVVEERPVFALGNRHVVDRLDLQQGVVALLLLGRAHLTRDHVAASQGELSDLGAGDVGVVAGVGEVAVHRPQKAVAFIGDLQNPGKEDVAPFAHLGFENLEHQVLAFEFVGVFDSQLFGDGHQLFEALLPQIFDFIPLYRDMGAVFGRIVSIVTG